MSSSYEKDSFYKSVLALVALSLVSAFFVFFPITNTDIWWHLATAREIFSRKSLLYTDPFSYTLHNPEWISLHTFFQIVIYGIYRVVGAGGLILAKCLAVACTCLLISLAIPDKRYMVLTAATFTLLLFEAKYLVLIRPVLITMIAIAVFLWAYENYIHTGRRWYLWLLLPVQIIWTNSQGLFPLGIVIAGCYLLGEIMQRIMYLTKTQKHLKIISIIPVDLTISFSLIIASCLINPYGPYGFLFPIKLLQRIDPSAANIYARNISENIPLFALTGIDAHYIYTVVLVTIVVMGSFWINRYAFRWTHLLLFGIFFVLAVMAKRNILLYFIIVPVIIGYNYLYCCEKGRGYVHHWLTKSRTAYLVRDITIGTIAFILCIFIVIQGVSVSRFPKRSALSPFRVPVQIVNYLRRHPIDGRMFNSIRYGGYLIWHLYPRKQVFIDGRLIIRSPKFFSAYLSILDEPKQFYTVANSYSITHVMLPTAIVKRYLPLVRYLYHSSFWNLAFTDGASILFVRNTVEIPYAFDLSSSDDVAVIRKEIQDQWSDDTYIKAEALQYLDELIKYLYM